MPLSNDLTKPWSIWHERLHKTLKSKSTLLPPGAALLLSVSGGQDSMVLLQLMMDLQRIYKWKLNVWHGDHGWHEQSQQIAKELKEWCERKNLPFYLSTTTKQQISTEQKARDWRYANLLEQVKKLTQRDPSMHCKHVVTGHTGSDRAETLIMNLARGTNLGGLSSLKEKRQLSEDIELVRPILIFSRQETLQICQERDIPIWIDPSNANTLFARNKIRKEVMPILESLHPGSTIRIAQLADRLSNINHDQNDLTSLAIEAVKNSNGINRKKIMNLSKTARATLLAKWIKENKINSLSANQLLELSEKVSKNKQPGSIQISEKCQIEWCKESINISNKSSVSNK
ncbi:tRNA lysidine(34) synthetase TilS [Prochlorococcus marinus]|uniref:tRNA lysidine(34) synthetase TilS n=1 Tax=Prochlorococcus marinus TaxID=1219 RepID=UPI0022B5412E|nr:tRNA lysidine(34) synthetase TilS [Prochlorococcus marinus]